MSTNVEIVRSWYESPNQESLVPDAEWLITEGFPAGGQYVGITAIFEEFFPRLHSYFSEWESKVNVRCWRLCRSIGILQRTGKAHWNGVYLPVCSHLEIKQRQDCAVPTMCRYPLDRTGTLGK